MLFRSEAVPEFLRTTRVGCRGLGRVPPEDRGEEESGEEGGAGPPWNVLYLCFSFVIVSSSFSFLLVAWVSHYDLLGRSGAKNMVYRKAHHRCFGSGGAAAMALRAACSGI